MYTSVYTPTGRFTWDLRKSERNLRERGFDFEFATQVFDGQTVEREDTRRDYGERRVIAIGRWRDITLTVVYTDRAGVGGTERRIISARVSTRRESQVYDQATQP